MANNTRRQFIGGAIAIGTGSMYSLGANAQAQDYPTRPITFVVPSTAGGPPDISARLITEKMSSILGRPITVDNAAGAGGTIGMVKVANAPPDGHTLLIHQTGFAIAPALYEKLTFDTANDFVTVGLVNQSATILVGRKNLPADNFRDFVAWSKASGKPVNYGHAGAGSISHIQSLLLVKAIGFEATLVPYRGIAPAITDLLGGQIDIANVGVAVAANLIKEGKIKGYAIGATKRHKDLPNLPSFVEFGHPELAKPFWHAMFAPAKTPLAIVAKLNKALLETLEDPKVMEMYAKSGVETFSKEVWGQDMAAKYVKEEIQFYGKVVRENNFKLD